MAKVIFNKIKTILKKYFWILIVLGVFFGVRWFYTRDGIKTVPVKVITPEPRVVTKTVSASGQVKSQSDANLSFGATGRVTYINVQKNNKVKKGDLLAQIDVSSTLQTVQAYKDARDIAIRDKDLYMAQYGGDISPNRSNDESDITLRRYDEAISKAEATYQAQLQDLSKYYIYAPFDGVVIDVTKKVGESATLGETIIKVANLDNVIFEIELDQEDYGLIKLGQSSEVELDAYENIKFDGEVSLLPMYADGTSGTNFIIEVTLNPMDEYKPLMGMTGDVRITVASTETEVPSFIYDQILFDEENKPYVFVVNKNNELIERYNIEIGLEGDIYTEVRSTIDKDIVMEVNDKVEIEEGYKAKIIKQ